MPVSSLQHLCLEVLKSKTLRKPLAAVHVLLLAQELLIPSLEASAILAVRGSYEYLRSTVEEECLVEALGEERFLEFEESLKEVHSRIAYVKQEGSVLAKPKPPEATSSGDFYSLESLQIGVQWPQHVNPTQREMYLSDEDFQSVFGMSKNKFKSLPDYVRQREKKAVGLW